MDSPNIQLHRRMGRLTNEVAVEWGGKLAFDCLCTCGGRRVVPADSFNNGHVTCCEGCVEKGEKPPNPRPQPVRSQLTLEPEVMAVLGMDVAKPEGRSSATIRLLLREVALMVGEVSLEGKVTGEQWEALVRVVRSRPELLEEGVAPSVTCNLLSGLVPLPKLKGVEALALLCELRWRLSEGKDRGE